MAKKPRYGILSKEKEDDKDEIHIKNLITKNLKIVR